MPTAYGGSKLLTTRILNGTVRDGYAAVKLRLNNSVSRTRLVHRLVAAAFLGPCPDGQEVLHGNGQRLDNRLENLRYGTRQENVMDTIRHGNHPWVGRTHCPNGHPYTPENTGNKPGTKSRGKRQCRACRNATQRRYRARKAS